MDLTNQQFSFGKLTEFSFDKLRSIYWSIACTTERLWNEVINTEL